MYFTMSGVAAELLYYLLHTALVSCLQQVTICLYKKSYLAEKEEDKKYCYMYSIAYLKKPRQNKFLFHGVVHFILPGLGFVSAAALTNFFLGKFSSEQTIILQSINSKINIFKSFLKIKFILY